MSVNRIKTRAKDVALLGIFAALMLIFMFIPSIGVVEVALALIPILILAEVKGVKLGVILSTAFGLASLIVSFTISPSPLRFAFQNPMISVVPRIFVGLVAALSYKAFSKLLKSRRPYLNDMLASYFASVLAVLTNTVLVLGMMLAFYNNRAVASESTEFVLNFKWLLMTVVSINTLIEVIIMPLACAPVVAALKRSVSRHAPVLAAANANDDVRIESVPTTAEDVTAEPESVPTTAEDVTAEPESVPTTAEDISTEPKGGFTKNIATENVNTESVNIAKTE